MEDTIEDTMTNTELKKSRLTKLKKKISNFEERFKETEDKNDKILKKIEKISDRLAEFEKEKERNEKRFNELEAKLNRSSLYYQDVPNVNQNTEQNVIRKASKIKKVTTKFLSSNSIYGLARAYNIKNPLSKIIWYISTFVCAFYGLWVCGECVAEYYQYDVITKVQIIESNSVVFPTIVFCPLVGPNETLSVPLSYYSNANRHDNPINQALMEYYADSGDCFRFNGNKSNPLFSTNGSQYAYKVVFKIKFPGTLRLYIIDNYINTYYDYENFNVERNLYYQFKISKEIELKQEEPYNQCTNVPDPSYRRVNCQQMCVYEQYAAKYNCSYVAFRSFLPNSFSTNRCFDEETKDRYNYKDSINALRKAALREFGNDCLKSCPKECITVKYSATFTAKSVNLDHHFYQDETLFYFYLSDLSYQETTQTPKVTLPEVIGNIGGAVGVFIGLNFLSIIELVEYFVEVLYILIT